MHHIILTSPFKLSELDIGHTLKFHSSGAIIKDTPIFKKLESIDYGTDIHFGNIKVNFKKTFTVSLNLGIFNTVSDGDHYYTYEHTYQYNGSAEEIFIKNDDVLVEWLDALKKEKDIIDRYVVVSFKKTGEGTKFFTKYVVNNCTVEEHNIQNEPVIFSAVLVKFYKYKGLKFWRWGTIDYKYVDTNPINNF